MAKKDKLVREATNVLEREHVKKFYAEYLEGGSQAETISALMEGISRLKISTQEALAVAFVVGLQWNVNFEKENPHP